MGSVFPSLQGSSVMLREKWWSVLQPDHSRTFSSHHGTSINEFNMSTHRSPSCNPPRLCFFFLQINIKLRQESGWKKHRFSVLAFAFTSVLSLKCVQQDTDTLYTGNHKHIRLWSADYVVPGMSNICSSSILQSAGKKWQRLFSWVNGVPSEHSAAEWDA